MVFRRLLASYRGAALSMRGRLFRSFVVCSVSNCVSRQGGAVTVDKDKGKSKGGRKPFVKSPPSLSVVEGGEIVHLAKGQGKDQNGLTVKQEAFSQGVGSRGETLAAAYRAAYDAANMTAATIHAEACRLMANPLVAARVNALVLAKQAKASLDATRIRQHVIERLHAESIDPDNPSSTRVRAIELLGKLDVVGAFRERSVVEAEHAPAHDLAQTLQARLQALLGKTG